jgi:hypothetical protein
MSTDKYKIPTSMLSPQVDAAQLGFKDTGELEPLSETIGQERAVEALEFGLHMTSAGFNLYVSGPVDRQRHPGPPNGETTRTGGSHSLRLVLRQ